MARKRSTRGSSSDTDAERGEPLDVFLLSGGSGRTAAEVVQAALAQFEAPPVRLVTWPRVRSLRKVKQILAEAEARGAVIVHSLVQPRLRELVRTECARRKISLVDILGPVLTALADHLGVPPRNRPGLSYQLQKERFDRIDSVDFTLAHDDGRGLATLAAADVILVGPSRVSKSVTCFYLATRGIRAANVPLILGTPPPEELLACPPDKVIALVMNVARLLSVRAARLEAWKHTESIQYDRRDYVLSELRHTEQLAKRYRWHLLDVSYLAVEETAQRVIELLHRPARRGAR